MPYGPYGGVSPDALILRQILGQTSPNYVQVAMLVGFLLVVIYRPERIRLLGMFRASCVLLAISIVLPPLVGAVIGFFAAMQAGSGRNGSDSIIYVGLLNVVEPALVATSVCLGIFSLLPPLRQSETRGPAHHPFDS
jgi:hypothetical protein